MCLKLPPMDSCLLCGDKADITPAEWSGGLMTVHCAKCGEYQAGSYVVDELDTLREKDDSRIQWLQEGIARSSELLKIARYEPAKVLVLKPSATKDMTGKQKKHRRRATRTTATIYFVGDLDKEAGT